MKNTGRAYENFVKEVTQAILHLQGLKTVEVKPSQFLPGKTLDESGNHILHEIDVHWEFELNGQNYRTVIQAKDWTTTPVKMFDMIGFYGIVKDMPGSTSGHFITKSRFQKGAISWAKAKGLKASELREPLKEEIQNRIQTIFLELHLISSNITISFDHEEWLLSLTDEQRTLLPPYLAIDPATAVAEDEFGNTLGSLDSFFKIPTNEFQEELSLEKSFDDPIFLQTLIQDIPRMFVRKLKAIVKMHRHIERITIHEPLTHILRSATGDESFFVSKVGDRLTVRRAEGLLPLPKRRTKQNKSEQDKKLGLPAWMKNIKKKKTTLSETGK